MPFPRFSRLLSTLAVVLLARNAFVQTDYAFAAEKKARAVKSADQYAAFDDHPKEQVVIAAEPCDDSADCKFFRLPYIQHGLLPVRVIITNNSERALSLDDARLQFISANNDVIPAATDDDLNRRLFTMRSTRPTKVPMPAPIPAIPIHHAPIDKKILQDENDFGFTGTVVNAHSTLAGYLFYDIKALDEPPLKGAQLYVKMVHTLDGKKDLFSFSIPFDKWLASRNASTKPLTPPKPD